MSDKGKVREDKKSRSYYVDLWMDGQHYRFYRLPVQGGDMVSCKTPEMAEALRYVINRQIDQGIFIPERFKVKKPLHMAVYAPEWLKAQTHLMETTRRDYEQYLNKWIVPRLGKVFLPDISEGTIEFFAKSLPLGPKGKDNVIGCLMKMLHDAERHKHIDRAPKRPVMKGKDKVVDPEVIWLEPDEQEKILAALAPQYRPIIEVGMMCGLRPAEARALQWADIYWDRNQIIVRHAFDRYNTLVVVKGKKPMSIPLYDSVRLILDDLRGKTDSLYVFVNERTGTPFGANLTKVFHRACLKAIGRSVGIAKATRTSFAQQLANEGIEIHKVSRLLRHSGTKVTKRYYEFQTEPLKSAVEKVRRIR